MRDERDWLEEAVRRALGRPAGRTTLRASDAERESIGARLRDAHAEGRLSSDELEERISRCYRARTQAELDRLVYDLPLPSPPLPARRRRPAVLVPILVVVLVAALVGHDHGAIAALLVLVAVLWLASGRHGVVRR